MKGEKVYLGDGVYVQADNVEFRLSDQYILTVEDGQQETARIYLDTGVITNLQAYLIRRVANVQS